jgi:hypothetical protein
MRAYREVSALVCRHAWIVVILFACAYGLRTSGEAEFRTVSAAPLVTNLPPQDQYLYSSPLTFWIGAYYQHHGLDYAWAFFTVNAIGLALFFVALRAVLTCECGDDRSAAALVLFTSPLLFVMLSWIGKSDAFLLGFFFLFMLSESAVAQAVLASAMVLCHAEMGAAVLFVYLCLERRRWPAIMAGVIVGETAVFTYTHFLLSPEPISRATYALGHWPDLWRIFWSHPLLHLAATFGPFWAYAATRTVIQPIRAFVFVVALGLAAASYDFTRVFVIVSTPLLLDITREIVADLKRQGSVAAGWPAVAVAPLWPLVFVQMQCAGVRLLFAQGVRLALRG